MGIPVSVVINTLYNQIIIQQGVPFPLTLAKTPATLEDMTKSPSLILQLCLSGKGYNLSCCACDYLEVENISFNLDVPTVDEAVVKRLSGKHAHHAVYSLRLVRLYGKFEFYCFFSLLFFFAVFSSPFIVSRYASSTGESVCS